MRAVLSLSSGHIYHPGPLATGYLLVSRARSQTPPLRVQQISCGPQTGLAVQPHYRTVIPRLLLPWPCEIPKSYHILSRSTLVVL
jgi:hypothetical protein